MDCGECTTSMLKKLPCGHQLELPCFVDVTTFPCEKKVRIIIKMLFITIIVNCFIISSIV